MARASESTGKRCTSYRRASGIFLFNRVRCELRAGHSGQHAAPGRWLDPRLHHKWGRTKKEVTRDHATH